MTSNRPPLLAALLVALSLAACHPAQQDDAKATTSPAAGAASATTSSPRAAAKVTKWQCGKLAVSTHFDDDSLESITLDTPDRTLTLKSMANADGARFADAAGNEFWSRPGRITLALVGQAAAECRKDRG